MSFVRKTWQNNPPSSSTPVSAAELNRIEGGIVQAMNNKGFLANGADLNSFTDITDNGSYYMNPTRVYENFPGDGRSPQNGAIFKVEIPSSSGNLGGLQEVVWGEHRWWREAINLSNQTWYPWHKVGNFGPRGWLPNNADLNTYVDASHVGIWYVHSSRSFSNFPGDRNSPDQGAILTVMMPDEGGENGGMQELTWGSNRWWREVRHRPANTWYEWQRVPLWGDLPDLDASDVVQSSTVKRIVTSANPDLPLEDGDLLIIWEGDQ